MKLKIGQSIPDLIAKLPEGTITYIDLRCLSALKECIKAMRAEHAGQESPNLFTADVRAALVLELNDALAQIIKARIPSAPRGRPRLPQSPVRADWQDLSNFRRRVIELREALEAFVAATADAASREPVGAPVDPEIRLQRITPAYEKVSGAVDTLAAAPITYPQLADAAANMRGDFADFAHMVTRWANTQQPAEGKKGGMQRSTVIANWIDACKSLSRDVSAITNAPRVRA